MSSMQKMSSHGLSILLNRLHQSRFLKRQEDRLWVLRTIRLFETSLPRLRPSRLFWCPVCRKRVRMAFRHLETSLHWLHQFDFFGRPEGRVHRTILDALYVKNELVWPSTTWNIASSTSPKSLFKTSGRQIMSSKGHSATWNITSAT
jgi:hypothetical protein